MLHPIKELYVMKVALFHRSLILRQCNLYHYIVHLKYCNSVFSPTLIGYLRKTKLRIGILRESSASRMPESLPGYLQQ